MQQAKLNRCTSLSFPRRRHIKTSNETDRPSNWKKIAHSAHAQRRVGRMPCGYTSFPHW